MTEMTMSHGPSEYFEKIMAGTSPIPHFIFGTAVRMFNVKVMEDSEIIYENWKPVWIYDAQMKEDKMVTVGEDWDLAVITGRGNTVEEAVDNVYDNLEGFIFKEKYYRTKDDFLADYPTSLINRFNATNGTYYNVPEVVAPEVHEERKVKKVEEEYKKKYDEVKKKLQEIMYGQQNTVQTS